MLEMKYLIVSAENYCVYTYTPRPISAYAMADGIPDAIVFGLTWANSKDLDKFHNRDFFYEKHWILNDYKGLNLYEADESTLSEDWHKNQELIRLRQEAFHSWESHTMHALTRTNQRCWPQFDLIAMDELDKCRPEENYYTQCIEEYAKVMMRPVHYVYKELKLQLESDRNLKFRIQAMSDRWKMKINNCTTQEEIDKAKNNMLREFWTNANLS